MKKFTKDTGVTFITQIVILIIGFAYNILIARLLGPEGKGIITVAYLFPFIFAAIAGLGLDEGNIYMIAKNKDTHGAIFSNFLLVGFIMTALSFLFLYLLRNFMLGRILKNLEYNYFIIITISIPFFILLYYGRAVFQGYHDFTKFNYLFIIHHGLNFIFTSILIIKFGILGALIAILISVAIASIIAQIWLLKYGTPSSPNLRLLKSSLSFGVRNKAGFVLDFLNKRLDMFIVNYFVGVSAVGYYSIAVSFAEVIYKLPEAFGMTLFPKIAQLSSKEGNEFTSLILRNVIFLMLLGSLLFAILIKPLIFITVGEKFYPSLIPFWILLPGIIFIGITRIITSNFQGQGKPEYGTYITIVSVISTITLDLILIPRYGAIGAAIASTISYGIASALSVVIFGNRSKIRIRNFLLLQKNPLNDIKVMLK